MTKANYESFIQTRYFGALDGLRCLSIFAVIWHHSATHTQRLADQGFLGVWLFFAISGFLITTLLLRERAAAGQIDLGKFYARRTLRIFPLYYAVLSLYVVLVLLTQRHSEVGRMFFYHVPFYATYTSNWFVPLTDGRVIFYFAWSLATEEQFYLIWPSVVRWLSNWYGPVSFMLGLILAKFVVNYLVSDGALNDQLLWVRMVQSIAYPICIGCIMAYVLNDRWCFERVIIIVGWRGSGVIFLAGILATAALRPEPFFIISLLMVCLVASVCVQQHTFLAHLLSNRAMRYVGQISYGMYLLHMLGMQLARAIIQRFGGGSVGTFFIASLMAIVLASISYWTFERWFLKIKKRFTAHPTAKSQVAVISEPVAGPNFSG
jgi:peptidoglycan/LPS O-acetylase OafA/YrhL